MRAPASRTRAVEAALPSAAVLRRARAARRYADPTLSCPYMLPLFCGYAAQNVVFSVWPDVYLKLRKVRALRCQACAFAAAPCFCARNCTRVHFFCGSF